MDRLEFLRARLEEMDALDWRCDRLLSADPESEFLKSRLESSSSTSARKLPDCQKNACASLLIL
jgi:hypothetical protein